MKILFALRPEIFSILIMSYLIIYDRYCDRYRNGKDEFIKFAVVDLAHCVMSLVTEITVNLSDIPTFVNNLCHYLFFATALLYSLFYLEYSLKQILPDNVKRKTIFKFATVLSAVAIMVMLCSPIGYEHGECTDYSVGIGPTLCYGLGFVFFILADIIFIIYRKKINQAILFWILPLSFVALGLLVLQILVPQFLYTAQAVTIMAVGLFFVIENPVGKFKDKAYIDHNTQIWNRNRYEYDMEHVLDNKLKNCTDFIYLMSDINGLKTVNDTLGHLEGDKLIEETTRILRRELRSAESLYRVGGDEFVALYFGQPEETVKEEAVNADIMCSQIQLIGDLPTGISIGYARRKDGENLKDLSRRAENMMYEAKREYYRSRGINRRLN